MTCLPRLWMPVLLKFFLNLTKSGLLHSGVREPPALSWSSLLPLPPLPPLEAMSIIFPSVSSPQVMVPDSLSRPFWKFLPFPVPFLEVSLCLTFKTVANGLLSPNREWSISLGEITESYLEQVVFDLGTEGWIGFFLMEVEEEEVNSKLKVQWRKETGVVKHWGST